MALIGIIKTYDGTDGRLLSLDEEQSYIFQTAVSGEFGVDSIVTFDVEGVGTTASGINVTLK